MIDTHAHLNFPDFDADLDNVIQKSFEKGVEKIIVPGSSILASEKAVQIAEKCKNIFATVGIHPENAKGQTLGKIEALVENKKVVAIGECGLDYSYPGTDKADVRKNQKILLRRHIKLAKELGLPLIFHNRDSDSDFYETVKDYKGKAVLHCYTGDWSFARKILGLGFLISFTGIVTFDKTGKLEEVIKNIPLEKIMVETDAPYLAPVPYRGNRCEPWMTKQVIHKVAEIKEISPQEVEGETSTTAKIFFKL